MKKNLGHTDKLIRTFISIALASSVCTLIIAGVTAIAFLTISFLLLLTVFAEVCPLYILLRIESRSTRRDISVNALPVVASTSAMI